MRKSLALLVSIVSVGAVLSRASDIPDSQVNPQTGYIETVSASWNGANHDLTYTINRGNLSPITLGLVAGAPDDVDPHIASTPSGDTWVVWTREGASAEVLVRGHHFGTSSWNTAREVGVSSEDSRSPEIVFDGTSPWVAYEIHASSATSIAVAAIGDDPDPIGSRTIVASTTWSGDLDTRIHSESVHLWVTWKSDATHIGFSVRDSDGSFWSDIAYQSVSDGDVDAALAAVQATVMGL